MSEDNLGDFWGTIMQTNIHTEISEREERKKGAENLFKEMIAKKCP